MTAITKDEPIGAGIPASATTKKSPPRRSRMLSASGRVALALIVGIALVAAAGATYETVAGSSDHLAYQPAGRLIDMGGYSMHIDCRGEGSPTVVMDAGLGGSSVDWSLVQPEVAFTTRVCTYDRAGMGWSEVSPLARTPAAIAEELHQLLDRAGVLGPFILVGHSLAGKTIRMFAAAHPADVAGMVLVDARSEYVDALTPEADQDAFAVALDLQGAVYSVARRLGVARLFGAGLVGAPLLPTSVATEIALLQTQPMAIEETTLEGTSRTADDRSLAGAALGSIPLVVVASASSMASIPNWSTAQHRLAALSTRGELVIAESGHAIQLERPRFVIDGIARVLSEIRHP